MAMMTFAHNIAVVFAAQVLAGLAASAAVPTFVVLIANNYKGKQQVEALGLLGGIQALAGMLAFFVAGALDTLASWRYHLRASYPMGDCGGVPQPPSCAGGQGSRNQNRSGWASLLVCVRRHLH